MENKKEGFPGCPNPQGPWPCLASIFLWLFSGEGLVSPNSLGAHRAWETLRGEMKGH